MTSFPTTRFLSAAVLLLGLAAGLAVAKDDRPHIVLVMADDHGWGDTGYNGHTGGH